MDLDGNASFVAACDNCRADGSFSSVGPGSSIDVSHGMWRCACTSHTLTRCM